MPDCLIFDVDGVLLDTSASFPEVIKICIKQMWEDRGGTCSSDTYPAGINDVLKLHGAFNDDYDIAWTMLNICADAAHGCFGDIAEAMPSPERLSEMISECAEDSVAWTEQNYKLRFDRMSVRRACEDLYFGADGRRGIYEIETPMLDLHWSKLVRPAFIYTGRDLREWRAAASLLKWEDMPIERVIHRDTGMTKPSPSGIDHICRTFSKSSPVMFGDSMSDKLAADARAGCAMVGIGPLMEGVCRVHYADIASALADMRMLPHK